MTRTARERAADVRRLLDAAGALVADRARVVPELVRSTGLSPEGVALALTRHLEVDATDDDIASLVSATREAPRVAVVLSANVFVGALRALALARAASAEVRVRPSRRDPFFARALVEAAADPAIALDEALEIPSVGDGEIHVYGRDETIADVRARARPGVVVRGHGSGMGVAVVASARAEGARGAARAIAEDVVAFDQRGCLSPRVVLALGVDAAPLAEALHDELAQLGAAVPRGDVPADERGDVTRYLATMTMAGRAFVGRDHVVGLAQEGAPLVLPPTYRTLHVVAASSVARAAELLVPLARAVVAVGCDAPDVALALAPPWARRSALGEMQRPRLDGPVDRRSDFAGA